MNAGVRTIGRLESGKRALLPEELSALSHVVGQTDAPLGAELAERARRLSAEVNAPLTRAPFAPPPPPPRAAPAVAVPAPVEAPRKAAETQVIQLRHLVDAIICAGADSTQLHTSQVRAVLRASLARAHEMGVEIGELRKMLEDKRAKKARRLIES